MLRIHTISWGAVGVGLLVFTTGEPLAQKPAKSVPTATEQPLTGTIRNADALCKSIEESYSMLDSAAGLATAVARMKVTSAIGSLTGQRLATDESAALRRLSREYIWLPITAEEMFGAQQHKARADAGLLVERSSGRAAARTYARVDKLFQRLSAIVPASVPYKLQLHVLNDTDVQAEALPGGYVYISRGALELGDDVALVLLGHEIAHITKRHQTKALQARLVDTGVTLQGIQTIMSNPANSPQLLIGAVTKMRGIFAQYDQQQELESDACAMRLMTELPGTKPLEGARQFLATQKETSKTTKTREEIVYASHPQYPEREQRYTQAHAYHLQQSKSQPAAASKSALRPTTPAVEPATGATSSEGSEASAQLSPPGESATTRIKGMFERFGQGIKGLIENPAAPDAAPTTEGQ